MKFTKVEKAAIKELISDYIEENEHWGDKEMPVLKILKSIKKKLKK